MSRVPEVKVQLSFSKTILGDRQLEYFQRWDGNKTLLAESSVQKVRKCVVL